METLNNTNFHQTISSGDTPVVVDFYADWCGPCKKIGPILDELAEENKGKARFFKVNTDQEPELAMQYEVMGIPNIVCFKNGEVFKRVVGLAPKEKLAEIFS